MVLRVVNNGAEGGQQWCRARGWLIMAQRMVNSGAGRGQKQRRGSSTVVWGGREGSIAR